LSNPKFEVGDQVRHKLVSEVIFEVLEVGTNNGKTCYHLLCKHLLSCVRPLVKKTKVGWADEDELLPALRDRWDSEVI
jgi:hypothetical protein